jgi:hypothetical protein
MIMLKTVVIVIGIALAGFALLVWIQNLMWEHRKWTWHEIKDNTMAVLASVKGYSTRHAGLYPDSAATVAPSQVKNPVRGNDSWLIEKSVSGKCDCLEFAQRGRPGQVVYCPRNDRRSFYLFALDDDGKLFLSGDGVWTLDEKTGMP